MKSLLIEAIKGLKGKDLDIAINNTRAYIQARGLQKETMYHKSLYLLVAKKMKQELKKGGLK